MRLISQDGMIDVPYEISALSIGRMGESATIYVRSKLLDEKPCVFATYSNTDKALKVMEMLREYKETKEIRSIPLTKSLMESFSNVKMENFEIYTDGTGDYLKVDIVKKVEYFKFPADEDVEV